MVELIVFYLIAIWVIGGAVLAVFGRQVSSAVFALFFCLFGISGFYVLLGADFLAVVQIVVYVGGILILLLFGILLTHRTVQELQLLPPRAIIPGIVAGVIIYLLLLFMIGVTNWKTTAVSAPEPTTLALGKLLLTRYLLPFEISSVTLLLALLGAAYLVRRGKGE